MLKWPLLNIGTLFTMTAEPADNNAVGLALYGVYTPQDEWGKFYIYIYINCFLNLDNKLIINKK